ncbi:hypothetical protein Acj9p147 [Acinetobacter phage Acj9]|uniref:Uncharacterized protein n=1 Tax=Acinetobacter phage Acj9 TaxID=760939 RepID=E5EPT1_9CAUD|nr:hypothetical protein Acj9p147 [Acinetobacter phage Acj9]ADG60047.1 hypothetical protein Acj9p147 [Acinetobacter phage Acj9]
MSFLQLVIRSLTMKRLGYIFESEEQASAAFNLYAYQIRTLCPNNRVEIDYINKIVKNNTCRTEEHYLCKVEFLKSDVEFFRCLSYFGTPCQMTKEKYEQINVKKQFT